MQLNKIKLSSAFFGLVFILASCGTTEWAKTDQKKLTKRCRAEGGSKSYCKCYLKNAMNEYPDVKDMNEIDFEDAVELSINCE